MQPPATIIRGALVFDGSGTAPARADVAVRDGRIEAVGSHLPADECAENIDATDCWLTPGLLDIHTHFDLEVEINPGLGEAVRHGTTTVVVGNCSIGAAFGPQPYGGSNAIVDCFTRVENMPKTVLQKCADRMDWDHPAAYLEHFEDIPLGPNIAALIPHSMLRIDAMGIDAAISRAPTSGEMAEMLATLEAAMELGYIGMSTDNLVFHYLANAPHKNKRLPTQFADDRELKQLIEVLRRHDRVWQATPDNSRPTRNLRRFSWSSGRLHGKPLRISALSALDISALPQAWRAFIGLAATLNSRLMNGKIHFQALSNTFRIWADGIHSPVFEELDSTRELIALEYEDVDGRRALISDRAFRRRFRQDWKRSHRPDGLLPSPDSTFRLDPRRMFFDDCPVAAWNGRSLAEVVARFRAWQANPEGFAGAYPDETDAFRAAPRDIADEIDFFLYGLHRFDLAFRWWMDIANENRAVRKKLLFNDNTLPGFNDSGAHISNMAFYDGNLVTLQLAQEDGLDRVAQAVHRLTAAPAEFFGIDVGRVQPGAQADLVLIDPDALAAYDSNANRVRVYNRQFEHDVLVNRSDGVLREVYIAGTRVWQDGCRFTDALGTQQLGRALRFSGR
ncbi:MAG: aminoacylase [Candidatus Dadabacteria bacterium]|nr:MAG: aminoacylase [Candidatus Dadabacteria bacterium]